jgi:hypothetical protein
MRIWPGYRSKSGPAVPVDATSREGAEVKDLLAKLEDRSYKTYGARLMASQRLAARNRAWNTLLISTATATTIASVALLTDESIYGAAGPTLFVSVSILSLVASLVTSSLDYSGRSRNMFLNYRRIQRLSAEVERAGALPHLHTRAHLTELNRQYDALLDESENHTEADYLRWTEPMRRSGSTRRERLLSALPFFSLLAPIGLALPLVAWMITT